MPETVEGFDVATYFTRLLMKGFGKLPIGLIKYKNEDASKIELLVDIDPKTIQPKTQRAQYFRSLLGKTPRSTGLFYLVFKMQPTNYQIARIENKIFGEKSGMTTFLVTL